MGTFVGASHALQDMHRPRNLLVRFLLGPHIEGDLNEQTCSCERENEPQKASNYVDYRLQRDSLQQQLPGQAGC